MFPTKNISFKKEARDKIQKGINILADVVALTLGPKGRHVLIDKLYSAPRLTKDGVSVAKEVYLKDRSENMGAQLIRGVADKTVRLAGDGTTTATILARAIVNEGFNAIDEKSNPMDVKRGIDKAVSVVVGNLKKNSKEITTSEEVNAVANISANGDAELAGFFVEAYNELGKNCSVMLADGGIKSRLEIRKGYTLNSGYVVKDFINNHEKGVCELYNPYIYIHDGIINTDQAMKTILGLMNDRANKEDSLDRSMLIIADSVTGSALSIAILNNKEYPNRIKMNICIIKAPSEGDARKEILQDIADVTGGIPHFYDQGKRKEFLEFKYFGRAEKVVIGEDITTIAALPNDEKIQSNVDKKCKDIEVQLKEDLSEDKRKYLEDRLSRLKTGIAVLHVGGTTELEAKERKDRAEDAMYAVKGALQEGIVPGGGIALLRAIKDLDNLHFDNSDQQIGVNIIKNAIKEPFLANAKNAGMDVNVESMLANDPDMYSYGLNVQTECYGNLYEEGVLDPTKVVRVALEGAASIASILLTTEAMIVLDDNQTIQLPQNMIG